MSSINVWIPLLRSYNDTAAEDICYKMWEDRVEVLDNPIHVIGEETEVVWQYFNRLAIEVQWHIAILYKLLFCIHDFIANTPALVLGRGEDGLSELYKAVPYLYDALFEKERHVEFVSYERFDWDEFLARPDSATFTDLSYISIDVPSRLQDMEEMLRILSYKAICDRQAKRTYTTLELLMDTPHETGYLRFEDMMGMERYTAQILCEMACYTSINKTVTFL